MPKQIWLAAGLVILVPSLAFAQIADKEYKFGAKKGQAIVTQTELAEKQRTEQLEVVKKQQELLELLVRSTEALKVEQQQTNAMLKQISEALKEKPAATAPTHVVLPGEPTQVIQATPEEKTPMPVTKGGGVQFINPPATNGSQGMSIEVN